MELNNKSIIFIIIGILLLCIICFCSIVILAFVFKPKDDEFAPINPIYTDTISETPSETDSQTNYINMLSDFKSSEDEIYAMWDKADEDCDSTEEYNVWTDKLLSKEEAEQLYTEIPALIDKEWSCYKTAYDNEINWLNEWIDKLAIVDCNQIDNPEKCETFRTEVQTQADIMENLTQIVEQDYNLWKQSDLCRIDALNNYFDDDEKSSIEQDKCGELYPSLGDEIDSLDSNEEESIKKTDEILEFYLGY